MVRIDEIAVPVNIDDFVAYHVERSDLYRIVASELAEVQESSSAAIIFFQTVGKAFQIVGALGFGSSAQCMDMIAHDLVGEDGQSAFGGADRTVRDGELEIFIFDKKGLREVPRGTDVPELAIVIDDVVEMPFTLSLFLSKS